MLFMGNPWTVPVKKCYPWNYLKAVTSKCVSSLNNTNIFEEFHFIAPWMLKVGLLYCGAILNQPNMKPGDKV